MISTQMPHLKKVLGCVTIMSGLMVTPQTSATDNGSMSGVSGEDNSVADDVSAASMSRMPIINGKDNRVADDVSANPSGTLGVNGENNNVAANVLKISGWYERYSNGQIVLYPVFKISSMSCMNGISDMNEINGMLSQGKGNDMDKMLGMFGRGTENLKQKLPQMTYGRFWIDKEGNLVLCPSNGKKPNTQSTENQGDMDENE